jgi:hypothetical protein
MVYISQCINQIMWILDGYDILNESHYFYSITMENQ